MEFTDLTPDQRQRIWGDLNSGIMYLLTGAGVSLDSYETNTDGTSRNLQSGSQLRRQLQSVVDLSDNATLQQCYSLLGSSEIEKFLTLPFICSTVGPTINCLARINWRRIYTLNIDNAHETAIADLLKNSGISQRNLSIFNYCDSYTDSNPSEVQAIVHLHGSVIRPIDGYVFSYTEYAKNMSRQNAWMLTLTQLMKGEPFIVAGTSLDEIDVEFYLSQRPDLKYNRGDGVISVLIEPYPNRLTKKICDDHGFVLFVGTTLDFFNTLEKEFGNLKSPYEDFQEHLPLTNTIPMNERVLFEETFETVPKQCQPSKLGARFLLGAPLTWELIAGEADIRRDAVSRLEADIEQLARSDTQVVAYLAEAGSGKSSLLKKVAFRSAKKIENVFYHKGTEYLPEEVAAQLFNSFQGDVIVFIDNAADFSSYFAGIISHISKVNILFVMTERIYRSPYINETFLEADFSSNILSIGLSDNEALRLIQKNDEFAQSDIKGNDPGSRRNLAKTIAKDPISIANCRIQNNFLAFDQIIANVLRGCSAEELKLFVLAALARYAFAGGVSKSVLHGIPGRAHFESIDNLTNRLPVVSVPGSPGYIMPARASVSERVLEVLKRENPTLILKCLVELCEQLAPRVNRQTIRNRSPDSKLAGGLMDFDRTVQKFIDDHAEIFYADIEKAWGWNSRYWEQLSLMKLSRFLSGTSDVFLLQDAIQNARYAYQIDRHPLSLTTLSKTLFAALQNGIGDRDRIFEEGWSLIFNAIEIEKSWTRVKPTAFVVAFRGVRSFIERGGILNGNQADEVREAIAITYKRKLNDKNLISLRTDVSTSVAS